jgi:fido (protein-threonine AMPylation protein)/DNA-binding CsgD family transcriptional regulator
LFKGIYKHAGEIRDYNISKSEWILDGDTVMYGGASDLRATLEYDFSVEKEFSYKNLSMDEIIKHLALFVSRLWQIHIFSEGNTRATAVFFIKYLRTLGFDVTNDILAENAWYFRNALVRANYTNLQKGVYETTEYLELFLKNLILGETNPLKNRDMHISGSLSTPKCNEQNDNCTLDCTLDELAVFDLLKSDGKMTQKEISERIKKSERTVKTITTSLQKKGLIIRVNGKRFGHWKVNIE